MQRRQITLEDGRYLIFYTFAEEAAAAEAGEREAARTAPTAEPAAEPQATEERGV